MVIAKEMTRDESKTALLAALDQGPKVTAELYDVVQMRGTSLGNLIRELLHKGLISRETTSRGRYRYYIGHTAPGWIAAKEAPPKRKMEYRVPVKHTNVARDYFNEARPVMITITRAPWECAA